MLNTSLPPESVLEGEGLNPDMIRTGTICLIASGSTFLTGVILQQITGWYPEVALTTDTMSEWLVTVSGARSVALLGVGLDIIALCFMMVVGLFLFRYIGGEHQFSMIGLAGYIAGISIGLAAFVGGFASTWAITDIAATGLDASTTEAIAEALMRIFLVMDDTATLLILTVGNGFLALAAHQNKRLPRWLTWTAIVLAVGLLPYPFRYFVPALGIAIIPAPLFTIWYVIVGVTLLRKH